MHLKSFLFILLASWIAIVSSESMPSRFYRLAYYNTPSKVRALEHLDDMISSEPMDDEEEDIMDEHPYAQLSGRQQSASTGRLFFKRLFGQQQQPIIPIVVTGGTNQGVTTTGTIPAASGTITTTPLARRGYGEEDNEDAIQANANAYEEDQNQAAQLALGQAGQEYVVTHPEVVGTGSDGSNVKKASSSINLRRPGKKGKVVKVRVPAGYTKYFKNGQKVLLRPPNSRRRRNNNNNRNRRRRVWN